MRKEERKGRNKGATRLEIRGLRKRKMRGDVGINVRWEGKKK